VVQAMHRFDAEVHMTPDIESFPHLGEHCENDSLVAHLTLWLLAVFAVTTSLTIIFGLRAL
jgi:hypothetical protein